MLFRGVAGAGKTSTLKELCGCLKSGGVENIQLIAPTNSAVDVLKKEKFANAQTVAMFLQNRQALPPKGSYLIIDESGLNSLSQGTGIIKLALQNDYRVLFVGDARQHNSVESGDFSGYWKSIRGFQEQRSRGSIVSRRRNTAGELSWPRRDWLWKVSRHWITEGLCGKAEEAI